MFTDCINYDNTIRAERTSPTDIDMFKGQRKIAHIHCEANADTEMIRKDFERIVVDGVSDFLSERR